MATTPPPTIIPPTAPHMHTVIFLHGRGDTAPSLAESLRYSPDSHNRSLPTAFPSIRWVFAQAPLRRCASNPGTPPVPQWFDIWNVFDFADHEELQAEGLRESVEVVRRVVVDEASMLGGRWEKVVLAGISQGAATAVHVLLNLNLVLSRKVDVGLDVGSGALGAGEGPRRLAAFLGFSCRMPFPGRTLAETRNVLRLQDVPDGDEVVRGTPVLLEHCVDDPLVLVGNGHVLRDTLRGFGAQVSWKEYPNGGHWFNSPAGMDDVVDFLEKYVLGVSSAGDSSTQAHVSPDVMDLS